MTKAASKRKRRIGLRGRLNQLANDLQLMTKTLRLRRSSQCLVNSRTIIITVKTSKIQNTLGKNKKKRR